MLSELNDPVEPSSTRVRASFRLFRIGASDLWAGSLFGIAHAGAMVLLVFAFAAALQETLAQPAETREWLVVIVSVLCTFPLALIWLAAVGGVILFLFAKAAPEPRTPGGWVGLSALAGGVVFYGVTLPFWARIEAPREAWPACMLLMAGTVFCQAGGAWGVYRALQREHRPAKPVAKGIRFRTGNLLWAMLDVSLVLFLSQLMSARHEKFLPLTALLFAFQIASLAMGAAVLFAWRETVRLHLYGQLPRSNPESHAVPRGTVPTPAD